MKYIKEAGVIITLLALSTFLVLASYLVVDVRQEIPQLDKALVSVQSIELNTTRTEAEMAGLINTTRHIALQEQASQNQQLDSVRQLTAKATTLLDDADVTVQQLGLVANSMAPVGPAIREAVDGISVDTHDALQASTGMIQQATSDLSNPDIQSTMDKLSDSSAFMATSTSNLADTTKDIKDYVHRETTPVRGFWNSVKALINLTWSIRGAAGL